MKCQSESKDPLTHTTSECQEEATETVIGLHLCKRHTVVFNQIRGPRVREKLLLWERQKMSWPKPRQAEPTLAEALATTGAIWNPKKEEGQG